MRVFIPTVLMVAATLAIASHAEAQTTCFGLADTDPLVCSGHGVCVAQDTCVCEVGYSGAGCEVPSTIPLLPWTARLALLLLILGATTPAHRGWSARLGCLWCRRRRSTMP